MSKQSITVEERKLMRERALGQAWQGENLIEIDPRQPPKEYLDTLIHESLHIIFPELSERKVNTAARKLSALLWKEKYRKVKQ